MNNELNFSNEGYHDSVFENVPERSYCTCCKRRLKTSSMVKVYYKMLHKTAFHCQNCMSVFQDNLYFLQESKEKYFLEFFSGSKQVTSVAQSFGFKTFCTDISPGLQPDLAIDIIDISLKMIPSFKKVFFIWASIPCTTYSVLSLKSHWKKTVYAHRQYYYSPVSNDARTAVKILHKTLWLIEQINPVYFIIENPRGALRHMQPIKKIPFRNCVSYSDFGESVYKPTDLFHNIPFLRLPQIKTPAGRVFSGSIENMNNAFERSKVPPALVSEIFSQIMQQHSF